MEFKKRKEKNIKISQEIQEAIQNEDFKHARMILGRAIKSNPNNPKFKSLLIKLHLSENNIKKAQKEVNKCTKLYPYDGIFIGQKVEIYMAKNEEEKAIELLQWLTENGLTDKIILSKFKYIAKNKNDIETVKKLEEKIKEEEKYVDKTRKKYIGKEFLKARTEQNTGKIGLRNKIYNKELQENEKIKEIEISTLIGKNNIKDKDIDEVMNYLIGKAKFNIIGGKIEKEQIETIIQAYIRIGKKEKVKKVIEKLEEIEYDGKEEILIEAKKNLKKETFDDYVYKINKKINENTMTPNEIATSLDKIVKTKTNTLKGKILAIRIFNHFNYESYTKNAIMQAEKKVKNEEEEEFLEKAISLIEEEKDNKIEKDKKTKGEEIVR